MCVYIIEDFSEKDNGIYSCSAENSKGVYIELVSLRNGLETEANAVAKVRPIGESTKIGFMDTMLLFLFA